ncbi:MAG: sigma-70 family RNA polymerase sigma factor [Saprospiraceae bacterium]|nr:sigma-70 family RNA polymerase sigma factor [Saprospiraceae bacterium]
MKRHFSDEELIAAIMEGGSNMEAGMRFLYDHSRYKEDVLRWLEVKGAPFDAANDVFQDGVRYLILNVRDEKFRGTSSLKTYLFRICVNLWNSQYRRRKRLEEIKLDLPAMEEMASAPDEILEYKEQASLLTEVLSQLGKSCKEVLGLWSLNYSMAEIAQKVGYKSDGMARKKKYDCFKKLMKLLQDRPDLMEDLLNNR